MKAGRKKKLLYLFLILLLPSVFYVIFSRSEHRFKALPFIGPYSTESGDTVYHVIPPFRFIDQDGREFTNSDMNGNICIVDFFFTRCPGICPKLAAHLLDLQNKLIRYDSIKIVSFTVDPEHDTAEVLKEYSGKVHAVPGRWSFITGSRNGIYDIAERGFFASAGVDEAAPGGFLHSELVFLVDRKGRLRGSFDESGNTVPAFDGTSTTEMKELADAVNNLLLEDAAPVKE